MDSLPVCQPLNPPLEEHQTQTAKATANPTHPSSRMNLHLKRGNALVRKWPTHDQIKSQGMALVLL